mmetsp:Transcript_39271/g.81803  ORF Transcript_39271/g.81803 Transcript_39271/m.81803 type:complete len:200 (+) Transcript_39271:133-732(+)
MPDKVAGLPLVSHPVNRGWRHKGVEVRLVHETNLRWVAEVLQSHLHSPPHHMPEEHGLIPCNSKCAACHTFQKSQGPWGIPYQEHASVDATRIFGDKEMSDVAARTRTLSIRVDQIGNRGCEVSEESVTIDEKDPVWRWIFWPIGVESPMRSLPRHPMIHDVHLAVMSLPIWQCIFCVHNVPVSMSLCICLVIGHREVG